MRMKRVLLNRFGSIDRWYKVRMLRKSVPYRALEVQRRDFGSEVKGREQDFEAYFRQYYPFFTALFNRFMEGFS